MGCGKSKQAVATENTLIKSKSKSKKSGDINTPAVEKLTNDDANVKINNADEIVKENGKSQEPGKKNDEKEGDRVEKKPDEAVVVAEQNVKGDGDRDEEESKGDEKEKVVVSDVSPKKDGGVDDHHDATIESIISEGVSGKSDYFSPRAKGNVSDADDKDAEAKLEKGKEVAVKAHDDKSPAPADEKKSSGEEKNSAAENEKTNAASTTDVKAN